MAVPFQKYQEMHEMEQGSEMKEGCKPHGSLEVENPRPGDRDHQAPLRAGTQRVSLRNSIWLG